MDLQNAKIYHDGSHYIAIRRTTRPKRSKRVKQERVVTVDEEDTVLQQVDELSAVEITVLTDEKTEIEQEVNKTIKTAKKSKEMTLKELFNSFYSQTFNVNKRKRKKIIQNAMRKYFDDDKSCVEYVQTNFERVERNFMSRKIRLMRKINMYVFNYFVTFTYDDAIHTEETFKKKLKRYLYNMQQRYDWKFIGVWERSPDENRLHFHGIFMISDLSVLGEFENRKDYNTKKHKMQIVKESVKVRKKFGRNDFREINAEYTGGEALNYILKYIEKTGTKLDCSGKLPAYLVGDILPDDIMCQYGENENKFVLADNFLCVTDGEILGEVSQEIIKRMPKVNN